MTAPSIAIPAQPPPPAPLAIRRARLMLGLTQGQAAALIYKTARTWISYETGRHAMDPVLFEVWLIKSAKLAKRQFPRQS
jgi:transcriptional regulator with XRE-family HTH domain